MRLTGNILIYFQTVCLFTSLLQLWLYLKKYIYTFGWHKLFSREKSRNQSPPEKILNVFESE